MKKSIKAALISTFIFPGAGHILLKAYITATILISATLIALYTLISKAIEQALLIHDQILSGAVSPDIATITDLVTNQTNNNTQLIDYATVILIIIWLTGIIDSYRIGRIQDNANTYKP